MKIVVRQKEVITKIVETARELCITSQEPCYVYRNNIYVSVHVRLHPPVLSKNIYELVVYRNVNSVDHETYHVYGSKVNYENGVLTLKLISITHGSP